MVVKNGTEAIVTYGSLPYLTKKEYDEKYLALRVYCRQDTWAMVEILRGLREAVKMKIKIYNLVLLAMYVVQIVLFMIFAMVDLRLYQQE